MGMVLQNPQGSTTSFVDYDLEILVLEEEIIEERTKLQAFRAELTDREEALRAQQDLQLRLIEANRLMTTFLRARDTK